MIMNDEWPVGDLKLILLHKNGTTETVNVSQINNIIQDNLFKIDALEAEVARLKDEAQGYDEVIADLAKTIKAQDVKVERLKAHTWQQERAAVVAWLRRAKHDEYPAELALEIDAGEHWQAGRRNV